MYKATLDFTNCTVEWDTSGQRGIEVSPELSGRKELFLETLGLKDEGSVLCVDIEEEKVTWLSPTQLPEISMPGLAGLEPAILAAMGFEKVDMRGVYDAVNLFINGQCSEDEFGRLLDKEAETQ